MSEFGAHQIGTVDSEVHTFDIQDAVVGPDQRSINLRHATHP
jgi:hypothetical protein